MSQFQASDCSEVQLNVQAELFKITETSFKQLFLAVAVFALGLGVQLYMKESQPINSAPGTQRTGTHLFPSMGLLPETAVSAKSVKFKVFNHFQ